MASKFEAAMKACLAPEPARAPLATKIALKATDYQDEDGIIIGRVSVAGNFDRENERITETALKSATWNLVMRSEFSNAKGEKSAFQGVDILHEDDTIGCDIVGAYYDYAEKCAVVHFRPHDRAIYEAAKAGEIIGFSWSGPYQLTEAAS